MFDSYESRPRIRCCKLRDDGPHQIPCLNAPVWEVHHKNVCTSNYCEQHVPPLGTPRAGGYAYRGLLRDYDESEDPKVGDAVQATIGGAKSYGEVSGFTTSRFRDRKTDDYAIVGIRVKWRGWKELSLPVFLVKHADPLIALALCAEDERPSKKRHHRR